jgi:prepilin-type N-terminal cleavage/methylation domain-containing protein
MMPKKNKKTKKGFSLVETLVAVAIFSLAAVMFAGSFASFLKNSIAAKEAQRNAESAQYVINLMAKTIRTSAVAAPTPTAGSTTVFTKLRVLDFSQTDPTKNCIEYDYVVGSGATIAYASSPTNSLDECKNATMTTPAGLTEAGNISGGGLYFSYTASNPPAAPYGMITIVDSIANNDPNNPNRVQTTTSLRQ